MCNIYIGASKASYASTSRSLRIHGAVTSIRLENEFWEILDEIARSENSSTPAFINTLYNELMEEQEKVVNFTSFLRVACSIYLANNVSHDAPLLAEAS